MDRIERMRARWRAWIIVAVDDELAARRRRMELIARMDAAECGLLFRAREEDNAFLAARVHTIRDGWQARFRAIEAGHDVFARRRHHTEATLLDAADMLLAWFGDSVPPPPPPDRWEDSPVSAAVVTWLRGVGYPGGYGSPVRGLA